MAIGDVALEDSFGRQEPMDLADLQATWVSARPRRRARPTVALAMSGQQVAIAAPTTPARAPALQDLHASGFRAAGRVKVRSRRRARRWR